MQADVQVETSGQNAKELRVTVGNVGKLICDTLKIRHAEWNLTSIQGEMWCILVCDPHRTIIICCTAVWAQACGLEHKTSFVIIVHLWFIRRPHLFFLSLVCWWGSITILPHLVHIIRTFATVTTPVLCMLVNTLQYHDTVDFVQDSETKDPQLVAERRVGRNRGKTMGTN